MPLPWPVQAVPFGLPSLLGMKGGGAPVQLNDSVVPTLDITQLYLLGDRQTVVFGNVTTPAVSTNFFSTNSIVPVGELWYVWDWVTFCSAGAGAACTYAPGVAKNGVMFQRTLSLTVLATTRGSVPGPTPFWAFQGDQFGVVIDSVTLTPTINGAVLVTRLRV